MELDGRPSFFLFAYPARAYNKAMFQRLCISNFAIIENVDVSFQDGFSVLTGETGAGKSLVIDSL